MKHGRGALIMFVVALIMSSCSASTQVNPVTESSALDTPREADAQDVSPTVPAAPSPAAPSDDSETSDPVETAEALPEPQNADAPTADDIMAALEGRDGVGSDLTDEEARCVARGLLDDDDLAARLGEVDDYTELSTDDQTTVAVVTFDCAPQALANEFSQSMNSDATGVFSDDVGACLVEAMGPDAANRRQVIEGFVTLGDDRALSGEIETPVVDTMVMCFPGSLFSGMIENEVLANPALAGAVDFDCIDERFTGEAIRPVWQVVVRNPGVDFDQLDASATEPMFSAIFACLSFGQVVAGQAAESGVVLSEETISCIDAEMATVDVAGLAASDQGSDELGVAMAGCMTLEERSGLGG